MTRTLKATLAGVAVLSVGLMAFGSNEVNRNNAVTPAARDILTDPEGVKAASAANAYVQAYVRENGRLPPVHHGQTVIIPGNPFKEGGASVGG